MIVKTLWRKTFLNAKQTQSMPQNTVKFKNSSFNTWYSTHTVVILALNLQKSEQCFEHIANMFYSKVAEIILPWMMVLKWGKPLPYVHFYLTAQPQLQKVTKERKTDHLVPNDNSWVLIMITTAKSNRIIPSYLKLPESWTALTPSRKQLISHRGQQS